MPFNFKGGIHPEDRKSATRKKIIQHMPDPAKVIIPLIMHKGTICSPIVEVGDRVKLGQKIAEATAALSAPIHASVSGKVVEIAPKPHPNGSEVMSIVIENDFEDEREEKGISFDRFRKIDADELQDIAREAGIVGLGGSAYPLSEKIRQAAGKVDTLIINGAECEPYITADNRMMIEYTDELYDGTLLVAKALNVKAAVIAVESDKPDAIMAIRNVLKKKSGVHLAVLHTKYPQGAERQIIKVITGREVPYDGKPSDIGVITMNVSTAVALARAVREELPVTSRVVTVAGTAVANPKNLLARIGTPIGELVNACGGFLEQPEKVIVGGPLMGTTQYTLDVPVIKGTNAVLAFLPAKEKPMKESACIHCGKCVSVCPMRLMPLYIHRAYKAGRSEDYEKLFVSDCTECGCCSYICPARIPLVAELRVVKQRMAEKKNETEDENSGIG